LRNTEEQVVSDQHSDVFVQALDTLVGAGEADPNSLFTDDVSAWSPALNVSSLEELTQTLAERDEALSNVTIAIRSLNSRGNRVVAEWRLDADHTGPLVLDDEVTVPATGRHIHLGGATFAEFSGDKISSFRTYFDEMALTEQLVGIS
jgi:predicted ester cyclase